MFDNHPITASLLIMKRKLISEQLRDVINDGPLSRYKLCKLLEIDYGTLHRFSVGKTKLSMNLMDRICELYAIDLARPRTRTKITEEAEAWLDSKGVARSRPRPTRNDRPK